MPRPAQGDTSLEAGARNADVRVLSGPEKAAALMLAMDKQTASRVLGRFEADEIKMLAQSATDLGAVSKATLDELIEEFARTIKLGKGVYATAEQVESLLSGVLPPDRLHEIMTNVRMKGSGPVWTRLTEVPMPTVAQHCAKEHPQITAFMLSRCPSTFAAALMKQLPIELQKQITQRMLAMRRVIEKPVRLLEETIAVDLLISADRNSVVSIHSRMADIINKMDRNATEDVLHDLETHKPKDTELIRQLLFTFDDIAKLSSTALTVLLDKVPADQITIVMHGANPKLKEMILSTVPARSRRMIEQELASGPTPKTKDVNKARRLLADLALDMIERGIIEVTAPEDEDE